MYIYPHKRNVDALPKVGVIIKVAVFRTLCCVGARIALATGCCCCWSIRSAPRRERGWMLRETSEKRAKICILNGILQLLFGSWCMERLMKYNVARSYLQIMVIFVPKQIMFTAKTFPQFCGRYHSSAFIYWISVGTRPYMDIDLASGRMNKTRRR